MSIDRYRGEARKGRRLAVCSGAAALMLLPVLAIRGTDAAPWHPPGDFIFLAILLLGVGAIHELAERTPDRSAYRVGVGIALAAALLSIWINLAVGIIGSEDNPANWLYSGVLAVAAVGAIGGRFRPIGMARAMIAAAIAQAVVSWSRWSRVWASRGRSRSSSAHCGSYRPGYLGRRQGKPARRRGPMHMSDFSKTSRFAHAAHGCFGQVPILKQSMRQRNDAF